MKANAAAADIFSIAHVSLWMPKVTPNLQIQTDLESELVSNY